MVSRTVFDVKPQEAILVNWCYYSGRARRWNIDVETVMVTKQVVYFVVQRRYTAGDDKI